MLDLTGLALHQWLGVSAAALIGYHLLTHWDWVKAVTQRFFGQTSDRSRLYYLLDVSLLTGFGAISLSGLLISSWLNLPLQSYELWRGLHVAVSISTLTLALAKIALHWRWIVDVARRAVFSGSAAQPAQSAPKPIVAQASRRDFLKLMGVVGGAAAIALIGVVNSEPAETVSAADVTSLQDSSSAGATTTVASAQTTTSTTACYVRCNKRCSYPGRCRRYTDSNRNGRCDLGECL